MTKFIGRKNNQVSTNAQLGGMAFQDSSNAAVGNIDIESISGSPNIKGFDKHVYETATNVFVYDTSKDSDGGAWRKRTQHTSWYNETLNTATRGSRREFPAVAVIVLESYKLTIYDGDDPDLPMWMVFNADTTVWSSNATWLSLALSSHNRPLTATQALNGKLVVTGEYYGVVIIDFIDESHIQRGRSDINATYALRHKTSGSIASRNSTVGQYVTNITGLTVNRFTNDVAMTVLPNAPIDSATGLPTPTIAVGTDGGVSVIKDDGTVVDIVGHSTYKICQELSFTDDNKIAYTTDNGTGRRAFRVDSIPSNDFTVTTNQLQKGSGEEFYVSADYGLSNGDLAFSRASSAQINDLAKRNVAHNTGLSLIEKEDGGPRHAFVTSSFNTGWQHGNIKGAFLADTDDTDVTGTELVTNGTFATDSDWEKSSHWTISGGSATMPSTSTYLPLYQYNLGLIAGVKYVASVDVTAISGQIKFDTSNSTGGGIASTDGIIITSTGSYSITFIAESDQDGIGVARYEGTTSSCTIDNLSVRIAEEDRSANDNGLAVYGTITKSAVATGADLVGYSGYSASNYFTQPNITAPGTGDFSITVWVKPNTLNVGTGNYVHVFSLGTSSTGGQGRSSGFVFKLTTHTAGNANGYSPYFFSSDGGTDHGTYDPSTYIPLGKWSQLIMMRRGGVTYVYADGELMQTGNSWTTNLTDTYLTIFKGNGYNEYGGDGEFALLRYSLSAPSTEQVKKIYEDEKFLFQENTDCTLYGSSDAVTALAYDEGTNLLHAGTSSGRSDFQGLCRINNTTTAVTTAISAYDGLIAQQ